MRYSAWRRHKRRRAQRAGGAGGLIRLFGRASWAVNLTLGFLSYFVLSYLSTEIVVTGLEYEVAKAAASLMMYVAPAFFVITAFYSAVKQGKRKRLLDKVRESDHLSYALSSLDWRQFEVLVGQMFRERGYTVTEGAGTADGGVDLTLTRAGKTYFVQCKHWRKGNVGVAVVRELFGVISLKGAAGGFVVCSGRFTRDAAKFAKKANIRLVGISELEKLLS